MKSGQKYIELEKKIAVLEYRVQEQRKAIKLLENGFDEIMDLLKLIRENPLGLKS